MKVKNKKEKDKDKKVKTIRSWVTKNKNQRLEALNKTVTPITETKKIRYTATKNEWLRRLSYFIDPDFLPATHFNRKLLKVDSNRGISFSKGRQVVRSATYISKLLQKSILKHDWHVAVSLLKILLQQHLTPNYLRFLTESIYSVVLSHPLSTPDLIHNFTRSTSMILDQMAEN